jgi:membrane-bound metal-dependent hydrolase YbcI (DUF457 family)
MLFWHLGGTVALVRYAFRDERMDLRMLMVGAVVADLLDAPVGLALWPTFGAVRLGAHSLVFASVVMVVVLLTTRRGRPRKRWMPLAIGLFAHLLLDAMWRDPETLWWPLLGLSFSETGFATAGEYLAWLLTDLRTWLLEAAGLVYLLLLARRAGLFQQEPRRAFMLTGRLDAPIGPSGTS